MNSLQKVFSYEGRPVRTVIVDGRPYWVAKDVCEVLSISKYRDVLSRFADDERASIAVDTPGGPQEMIGVNEPGLYRLIFVSNKEEAEPFKRWVTHEVLPTIRRHGAYMTPETIKKALVNPDFIIELATRLKEEQQARLVVEHKNAILMHVNKTYTTTEIAKELSFRSATALNKDLSEKRIQYKQNNTWVLYSDYANRGYTEIKQEVLDNGKVIYHRRWTQLGREFLLKLYDKEVPLSEPAS